ncbi:MAG: aminotransferase class III-fold pyridoxal phosphate-dependent enzyme, partial [Spirochaetia bacterium]|nr:aminotransferase class III-fold pyridoxal phosphate-dependent enzyme [Spirochaetia bacterium]
MKRDEEYGKLSIAGAPKINVVPPGPKSKEILSYQDGNESSAVSYSKGMPMAMELGRGATIQDADGNVYIDLFGGAGVMALGHGHPEVLKAAHEQIDKVTHSLDIPTATRQEMVKTLKSFLP